MAIPEPIKNRDRRAIGKFGRKANNRAPKKAIKKAHRMIFF
jgi:hypothetical protein